MISNHEIIAALKNSGYLLEDRVNKKLAALGWTTIPNSRYLDNQTEIEREIDIVALSPIRSRKDYINSCLLIECMNNREPILFFENLEKAPNRIAALSFSGFNNNFWDLLLKAQNKIEFLNKLTWSSQYCSFQQVTKNKDAENNGWIAYHPNDKHDSLSSFFKYIKFHQAEFSNRKNSEEFIVGFFHRPLVILQGELMSVEQSAEIKIHRRGHIKYQIPKTNNYGRFFTIDIITEDFLTTYLEEIKKEDEIIAEVVNENRALLID